MSKKLFVVLLLNFIFVACKREVNTSDTKNPKATESVVKSDSQEKSTEDIRLGKKKKSIRIENVYRKDEPKTSTVLAPTSAPTPISTSIPTYAQKTKPLPVKKVKPIEDKNYELQNVELFSIETLTQEEKQAFDTLISDSINSNDPGQTLMYLNEDLSTNPYMQNGELFDYVDLGVVNYQYLVQKHSCEWGVQKPCLIFFNDQLKVLSVKRTLHRDNLFFIVTLNELPSTSREIYLTQMISLAKTSNKRVVVFSKTESVYR